MKLYAHLKHSPQTDMLLHRLGQRGAAGAAASGRAPRGLRPSLALGARGYRATPIHLKQALPAFSRCAKKKSADPTHV